MPLDFILDKINQRRSLNLLGMTAYSGLYRFPSLSKFIGWISEGYHNYCIFSTKRMINVPAFYYYTGERVNNPKHWIGNITVELIST